MTYRKMFFGFSSVCFTENKWSTENIFLVNGKSSHFSVKCLMDFKSVKHFTEKKNFFFFSRKIFFRKSFSEKYFPVSRFTWTKRSLNYDCNFYYAFTQIYLFLFLNISLFSYRLWYANSTKNLIQITKSWYENIYKNIFIFLLFCRILIDLYFFKEIESYCAVNFLLIWDMCFFIFMSNLKYYSTFV